MNHHFLTLQRQNTHKQTLLRPPSTMTSAGNHILVFPYPAQGHMIPLLDLTHQLAIRGLSITILVTPKNLPILTPLLSTHPTIETLVFPLPPHPAIPAGVENVKDLPNGSFSDMMRCLADLYDPIVKWFKSHNSPPVAIVSDMFLGWTHHLACHLGIRRFIFSPSGALALSVIYSLWTDMPRKRVENDQNAPISFPKIPRSPTYPWWQLSPIYRSYVEGDPASEFIKDGFLANIASWGLVVNSFSELERVYLDHLMEELGHERVWAVGPLLPPGGVTTQRGGCSSVDTSEILSWLDTCDDQTVIYVCFGSQAVLNNNQMEELALGLEKSGAKFIWSVKEATKRHEGGKYGMVPPRFDDRVAGRGVVIRGWAPQVTILRHRAVGAMLTHCGWNSILEALAARVYLLAWPMGADQFSNATVLVDELKVAVRVCEGTDSVPKSDELAQLFLDSVSEEKRDERARVVEFGKAAAEAIEVGGSSFKQLDKLVGQLSQRKQ